MTKLLSMIYKCKLINRLINKTATISWLYCCLFYLLSCTIKVNTNYDQSAAFEGYQSFCWFENCEFYIDGPVYLKKDSATIEIFKEEIVKELQRKGYIYDHNNPDFLLHLHIVVEEQQGFIASAYNSGDPDDWQGAFPYQVWDNQPYVYLKGSLIIDIADDNQSKMVWRADAVEYMDLTTDLSTARLRKGVRKVLEKFPPDN